MSDLTRYRRVGTPKRVRGRKVVDGFEYVPDSTLQDIAHAAKAATDNPSAETGQVLADLLNGLVNDE